jgi:hypothetical protein
MLSQLRFPMRNRIAAYSRPAYHTHEAVQWKTAVVVGLIVGCVFLFATAGNPWAFSALIVPTVMGREMFGTGGPNFSFGYMCVHLAMAAVFAVVMAPVIHRFRIGWAIPISLLFGLLFYGVNYAIFHYLFPIHSNPTETGVLLTNVAFAVWSPPPTEAKSAARRTPPCKRRSHIVFACSVIGR